VKKSGSIAALLFVLFSTADFSSHAQQTPGSERVLNRSTERIPPGSLRRSVNEPKEIEDSRKMQDSRQPASGRFNPPQLSLEHGLIRKSVEGKDGKKVGTIEDVIFTRVGEITLILLDSGGFLGEGVRTVALRPDQIEWSNEDKFLFSGTGTDIENMPQVSIHAFRRPYRGFYGPCGRGPLGLPDRRDQYCQEGDGAQKEDLSRPHQISSDFFMGAPVFNRAKIYIGGVEDLVVDLANRRVTRAVIEVGGFLGIESKKVIIPFRRLTRVTSDYVVYPGSKSELERMPAYQADKGGQVVLRNGRTMQ